MATEIDNDEADALMAKIEAAKEKVTALLNRELGFISDKDFRDMMTCIHQDIDEGTYDEQREAKQVMEEWAAIEGAEYRADNSTYRGYQRGAAW